MSDKNYLRAFFVFLILNSFAFAAFWNAGQNTQLQLSSEQVIDVVLGDGSLSKRAKTSLTQDYGSISGLTLQFKERKSTKDALIVPATRISGHSNVTYYGQIKGTIDRAFKDYLQIIDTKDTGLEDQLVAKIKGFKQKVNIKVLATASCPYCYTMAANVIKLAYLNPGITVEIVNISDYQDLAMYYNVRGVPLTIINEKYALPGAVEPGMLMEYLKQID